MLWWVAGLDVAIEATTLLVDLHANLKATLPMMSVIHGILHDLHYRCLKGFVQHPFIVAEASLIQACNIFQ